MLFIAQSLAQLQTAFSYKALSLLRKALLTSLLSLKAYMVGTQIVFDDYSKVLDFPVMYNQVGCFFIFIVFLLTDTYVFIYSEHLYSAPYLMISGQSTAMKTM